MKKSIHSLFFILVFILAWACTTRQTVKFIDRDFAETVQQYQNLTFTFNQSLVTDSMLNRWDSVSYLLFDPAVRGNFMWIATDKLVFSPVDPFAPSTDFTVRLSPDILTHTEVRYIIDGRKITFHTPYLDLESVSSYWAMSEMASGRVEVRIKLNFSYDVDPEILRQVLHLEFKSESIDFALLTRNPSNAIEIAMDGDDPASWTGQTVNIIISPGLYCTGSTWKSQKTVTTSVQIPSKEDLQVSGMTPVWDKGKGSVLVRTTQPVNGASLKEKVTIDPPVTFTVEAVRDGIQIDGEFMEGQSYKITLSEKITGIFGKELGKAYNQYITFTQIEPFIGFTDKNAMYLSSKGERNLGIQIVHVPKIRLSVFKIYENNLMHYLRMGKQWEWMYEDGEYHDFYNYSFDSYYGQSVFTKEIETNQLPRSGNFRILNLDLNELKLTDTYKGVYLIKVESTEKGWLQDVQMVSLSDIGLIVKDGIDDIYVFANSLLDASPLTEVRVDFISQSNQVVASVVTDEQGLAVFRNKKSVMPESPVRMITARKGDDFNFLSFNEARVETSRFNVGGKRTQYSDYDVFIYGDRELYRPGDSVYMNAIVRTVEWKTVPNIPIKIRITSPDGRDYLNLKKILNQQGAAESRFQIPVDAMTGSYVIDVYSGNDVLIGSSRFRVEEFMPDRIKVTVMVDKEEYRPGEDIRLDIQATNLFGPPAAGRNYEVELQLRSAVFQPDAYPAYSFRVNLPSTMTFNSILREGKTDNDGLASETFRIDDYTDIGLVEGKLFTTVFDETGRPVNRSTRFDLLTQNLYYGIRNMDYWVDTRRPLHFGFIAVDQKGEKVRQVQAYMEIVHIRWETVIERRGSRYTYRSEKQESVVYGSVISLDDGSTTFDFTPSLSGMYEVRIAPSPGGNYVSREFYAYGYGDTDYTSFEVSREGEVLIELDREVYSPGNKAKALFKAPFDGSLLVCIERGDVLEFQYVKTKDKAASLTFVVSDQYVPNVYISVTAIRKTGMDDLPLTVAHGYASMNVEKKTNKLDLTLKTVDDSRSRTKQTITVKTHPGSEVTVAVVDEGILQITDYSSPDPFAWFYQKRALEVNPYDLYAWLYPELKVHGSSFGGGEGFDLSKRINPMTNKRVKLVSLWSGLMKADSKGECTFTADIPPFSGSLRVMAVAYKDHRFATVEHSIRVADPIVISSALPRFLSPKDKVIMPVLVSNTTGKTAQTKVTLDLKGPLTFTGKRDEKVDIPANSEKQVFFELAADQFIGEGKVTVEVTAFGEQFTEDLQIPVRPAAGLQKITGSGAVNGGETAIFTTETDFLDATTSSYLLLSKSPVVEFSKNLLYLINYPYGCIEQTVSRAFPLLYYDDLAGMLDQEKKYTVYSPEYLVQEAIRKIYSMQQYDGGILYWPGGDRVSWWGTIYAAHFLTEAKRAGFAIDQKILNQMLRFINAQAKEKETEDYYYRDAVGNSTRKQWPKREIFYSLYVLALNGSQNVSLMNHYKPIADQLTDDSRYLLACAFKLSGDESSYLKMLPSGLGNKRSQRAFSGSFYSHTRDLALILSTLLEVDPDNPQVPVLSKALSLDLKQQSWLSTQESSFALLALGKLSNRAQKSTVEATVAIGGVEAGRFTDKTLILHDNLNNKPVNIHAVNQGILYYSYEVEGISASGKITEEDRYMEVRKGYYTRTGTPINTRVFEQNDLIVIKISIRSTLLDRIENVAITDILPACFEIENPRISPERELNWIKDRSYPEYLDIRDDRITVFTTAFREWKHFYYMVRAVSQGEYSMGPVSADAMYNGEYHSYSGGGVVVVR